MDEVVYDLVHLYVHVFDLGPAPCQWDIIIWFT